MKNELDKAEEELRKDAKRRIKAGEIFPKTKTVYIRGDTKDKLAYSVSQQLMKEWIFKTLDDTGEILYYDEGIYIPAESKIDELAREILGEDATVHVVKEVIGHIKGITYISRDKFDISSNIICLKNGLLNLKSYELEEFSSDKFFLTKIPLVYNKDTECPTINKFFKEVLNEKDIINILELFGYCLLKEYPIHKAFMLVGEGSNGKSTIINLLKNFIGEKNCSGVTLQDLDNSRFSVASLHGKMANLFADLPSKQLSVTGKFKMLTGQDTIGAEKKFKENFTFSNYAKLIFSTNQMPKTKDDTTAFWRRWIIINFPNTFEGKKADKRLLEKLITEEELSGLLNLALNNLKKLLKEGDFSNTLTTAEIREKYIRMSDSEHAFIMDSVEINPESFVPKKVLYSEYCKYCREKNYPVINEQTFHKNLPQYLNVRQERLGSNKREYVWKGIKLIVIQEVNQEENNQTNLTV